MNKGSASASEILAGWLKEEFGASIVGERTYGKGCVQTVYPFFDGSEFHLTTALYFVGKNKLEVNGKGIMPTMTVTGKSGRAQKDMQLEKAIEIARKINDKMSVK